MAPSAVPSSSSKEPTFSGMDLRANNLPLLPLPLPLALVVVVVVAVDVDAADALVVVVAAGVTEAVTVTL